MPAPPFLIRGALAPISHKMDPGLLPGYLAESKASSSRLADPTSSRKLLVLDLNGTLLLRPRRTRASRTGDSQGRKLRVVHPRPFMQSFREYLCHPHVREWLDTMVWSSAQPHSVEDMVKCCFGDRKDMLVAIWARDTMGLDPNVYHERCVTIKDLNRIWSAFPNHSASSTLLVDDSIQKARLQPWNHICIHAYAADSRARDLEVWRSLMAVSAPSESESRKSKKRAKKKDSENNQELEPELTSQVSELTELVSAVELSPSALALRTANSRYDNTLLALIGILETLKYESNVSSYIRHGGLSRTKDGKEIVHQGTDMWFTDVAIARGWAQKGKKALKDLSIELTAGVHG